VTRIAAAVARSTPAAITGRADDAWKKFGRRGRQKKSSALDDRPANGCHRNHDLRVQACASAILAKHNQPCANYIIEFSHQMAYPGNEN
jgi:hypothetical protein